MQQQQSNEPSFPLPQQQYKKQKVFKYLKNMKINVYTSQYVVQLLNKDSLVKIEEFMRKNKTLKIAEFLRFFSQLLSSAQNKEDDEFFIYYALFKLFQQICNSRKKTQITFSDLSSYLSQKMPNFTQQSIIQQKLLPTGLDIPQEHKSLIVPPQIYGQFLQDRCYFMERPIKSDKIQHLGRDVGQTQHSIKNKLYFSIDKPSTVLTVLDEDFNMVHGLKTEQEMAKRDMIINYIAWSEREEKIACILGNYSISMWSKEDNYKYEVNVGLPHQYLQHPFVIIKYMDSMRCWITLDNRPAIHVLSNRNYEPQYTFSNPKIAKKKEAEKILLVQLHYVQLLCLGFERSVFLVSLTNKQIVSEVSNLRTAITSIAFSSSYQALFLSTYQNYFRSYELSEYQDLMERGRFQGHKSVISLLGVVESKPVVFSLQESSILKMFDMRDYTCYQSFSVLKNILYKQVIPLADAICLVGSKMHVYRLQKELAYQEKQVIISIGTLHKDLLVASNKYIRIYDIRNGCLKSVVKAVFGESQSTSNIIYFVYCLSSKEKIVVSNEEGECIIIETKEMSVLQRWKLEPKPLAMHYDQENDLLSQASMGNISINLFNNEYCQKEVRRTISNKQGSDIRIFHVSVAHDLLLVGYREDESLYFYSYEKGKLLGFLNYGEKKIVKFKNAYREHKVIHRIILAELHPTKNLITLLLSDQLLVLAFRRTAASMTFLLRQSVKLWKNPMKLIEGKQFNYNQDQEEEPLHSKGFAIFDDHIAIVSNKVSIICNVPYCLEMFGQLQPCSLNRDNYNPSRIGHEEHIKPLQGRKPMVTIRDLVSHHRFQPVYHIHRSKSLKLEDYILSHKIGNLFVIADTHLNIIIFQNPHWNQIAGIINCEFTLPKLWNIFMYSEQQIQQIQFVLEFIQNQLSIPYLPTVKVLVDTHQKIKTDLNKNTIKITMDQLLKENNKKNEQSRPFKSTSLREKKMMLEKEKDEKEMMQNFLEQQKLEKKLKPTNNFKSGAQKQINDTLQYLSLNHNETILKKGIIDDDLPAIKILQKKLAAAINKDEKISILSQQRKSLISKITHQQSKVSSTRKIQKSQIQKDLIRPIPPEEQMKRSMSTQFNGNLKGRLSLKNYSSKQLIQTLNTQKIKSKLRLRTYSKQVLPRISK